MLGPTGPLPADALSPTWNPYVANNNTAGVLTVTDSTHSANIALLGSYMAASFASGERRPWWHRDHRRTGNGGPNATHAGPFLTSLSLIKCWWFY